MTRRSLLKTLVGAAAALSLPAAVLEKPFHSEPSVMLILGGALVCCHQPVHPEWGFAYQLVKS